MRIVRPAVTVIAVLTCCFLIWYLQNRPGTLPVPDGSRDAVPNNLAGETQPRAMGAQQSGDAQPNEKANPTPSSQTPTEPMFEMLYRKSSFDAKAAEELWALASFCDAMRLSDTTESRLGTNSIWRRWQNECNKAEVSLARISELPRLPDSVEMKRVDELSLSALTGNDASYPDSELSQIIADSNDYRAVAAASQIYFSQSRLRTWAEESGIRSPWALPDSASRFATQLSIILACQSSMNCRGDSIFAVRECSLTPACVPGTPMEEIVRSRISPVEWTLLQQFAGRARGR